MIFLCCNCKDAKKDRDVCGVRVGSDVMRCVDDLLVHGVLAYALLKHALLKHALLKHAILKHAILGHFCDIRSQKWYMMRSWDND